MIADKHVRNKVYNDWLLTSKKKTLKNQKIKEDEAGELNIQLVWKSKNMFEFQCVRFIQQISLYESVCHHDKCVSSWNINFSINFHMNCIHFYQSLQTHSIFSFLPFLIPRCFHFFSSSSVLDCSLALICCFMNLRNVYICSGSKHNIRKWKIDATKFNVPFRFSYI